MLNCRRFARLGMCTLICFSSLRPAAAEPAGATAPVPLLGSLSDVSLTTRTVGDVASGVLCTSPPPRSESFFRRSKKDLVVRLSVTGFGQPLISGRPFVDQENPFRIELRDANGAVIATKPSGFGLLTFDEAAVKVCVIGIEAPVPLFSDAGVDGAINDAGEADASVADAGPPKKVEFCKDVPVGLSLEISEDEQRAARAAAQKACEGSGAVPATGGLTAPGGSNDSGGCRVAKEGSAGNEMGVTGMALAALGVAAFLRRRGRS
jgi:MYXO-CTERM domain-containing protein